MTCKDGFGCDERQGLLLDNLYVSESPSGLN